MGMIKTYRNLDFSAGSEYEANAANFPACAHFFNCEEAAGATTLTDVVGDVVMTTDAGITIPAAGAIDCTISLSTAPASGTITAPGTKSVVAFAVGNIALLGISYGGAATQHLTISGAAVGCQYQGDSSLVSGTALTGGAVYGIGFTAEIGGDLVTFEMNDASGYVPKAAVTMAANTTLDTISNVLSLSAGNTSLYGFAYFFFDTLPTDIEQAVAWMTQEWRAGNKQIYPGWKGRS